MQIVWISPSTPRTPLQNDQKLIQNFHRIMRNDPCHHSTFGVTVEDTEARLWFACRSVTVVSKAFDFVTNPNELIHLVCSLAFTDDSELGWNPTIPRVVVEGEPRHDITFQEKEDSPAVYRTVAIISDFGADAMTGSGTRVFKSVQGKSAPGLFEHAVIKDAWRDSDRDREDQILQNILNDIGQDREEDAKKHFLTVLRAEDVNVKGRTDDTLHLLHGETTLGDYSWYEVWPDREPSRRSHVSSVGRTPTCLTHQSIPVATSANIQHKKYFRIVFKEVCQPISELKSLHDALDTLANTVMGLRCLHTTGWVHRDISSWSVLRCGRQGFITDLEYAKRTDSDQSHEVRTGTPDFMACEVEAQRYLFFPDPPRSMASLKMRRISPPEPGPLFRANCLHDLESLWWILMWVLHYHVDEHTSVLSHEQETLYQKYFPGLSRGPGQTRLSSLIVAVNVHFLPQSFWVAASLANDIRASLHGVYQAAELSSGLVLLEPYSECSEYFSAALESAAAQTDARLVPMHALKKRKLPESRQK
ncbi:hypothetical protein PAXINDRAFT_101955 [Paxillus involutus ATCC 200175]|uniref:Unplaced genomic scaffold PAXINscaffold_77, whole genome shotgun sequence n=1 Tax=Paxillus involutus ATCC 200175 TaxID=664439 RepID=A0A0C9TJ18_PAXIN|nr:hypothetical protein PAXINDRAFT_101955 [Paxillus involutus ATCC 200175]